MEQVGGGGGGNSVQVNHLHLMVEGSSSADLANQMRTLFSRIAFAVNAIAHRHGKLFRDRHHRHDGPGPRRAPGAQRPPRESETLARVGEDSHPSSLDGHAAGPRGGARAVRQAADGEGGLARVGAVAVGEADEVLYVGKAKSLKKRVVQYAQGRFHTNRIAHMVDATRAMEFVTTRTEADALLLEINLIKSLKPRYNVLLRDDKSYPYILLTDETWPRIGKHRGPRSQPGRYFGPYPSGLAVNETLDLMQKIFKLRSCEDSFFRNRSRPCLQHQIGRCTAPCVGLIATRDYDASVRRAALFLDGRSNELVDELTKSMDAASGQPGVISANDTMDIPTMAVLTSRKRS